MLATRLLCVEQIRGTGVMWSMNESVGGINGATSVSSIDAFQMELAPVLALDTQPDMPRAFP